MAFQSADHLSQSNTATKTIVLTGIESTQYLGGLIAAQLAEGDVIRLNGDLGAGKTELARSMIRARAGGSIEVPSPTFGLMQHYQANGLQIVHLDLYRLGDLDELIELGVEEFFERAALIVEWPEIADDYLPSIGLDIRLAGQERGQAPEQRIANLTAFGEKWLAFLASLDVLLPVKSET